MSSKNRERVFMVDSRTIEMMTVEERDDYFMSFSGMKYDEWCEYYKNDTPELREKEFREYFSRRAI